MRLARYWVLEQQTVPPFCPVSVAGCGGLVLVLVFLHMTVLVGGAGFRGLAPVFCGVGLWGLVLLLGWCVVGLLFENYIVNASIFIEKL